MWGYSSIHTVFQSTGRNTNIICSKIRDRGLRFQTLFNSSITSGQQIVNWGTKIQVISCHWRNPGTNPVCPIRSQLTINMKSSTTAHRVSIWMLCRKTLATHSWPFLAPPGRFSVDIQHSVVTTDTTNSPFLVLLMSLYNTSVFDCHVWESGQLKTM